MRVLRSPRPSHARVEAPSLLARARSTRAIGAAAIRIHRYLFHFLSRSPPFHRDVSVEISMEGCHVPIGGREANGPIDVRFGDSTKPTSGNDPGRYRDSTGDPIEISFRVSAVEARGWTTVHLRQ